MLAAESLTDEKALVARLRTGDEAAFNQVYARFHRDLYAYLRRATGRTSTAEDLLQETWVKFAKATPRLLEDTRLAPYLFTIALNVYRSHRRWAAFDLSRVFALDLFGDDEPRTDGAAAADARLEALELEAALAQLRESDRELILLTAVHGFEPHEVAAMMSLAPDALRTRLSRARGTARGATKDGQDCERCATIEERDMTMQNEPSLDSGLKNLPIEPPLTAESSLRVRRVGALAFAQAHARRKRALSFTVATAHLALGGVALAYFSWAVVAAGALYH